MLILLFLLLLVEYIAFPLRLPSGCSDFTANLNRIAVDYGPRVIGTASAMGSHSKAARDIKNIGNLTEIAYTVLDLALEKRAVDILVGLPLDSNGKLSYKVRNFNGRLCLNFSSVLAAVVEEEAPEISVLLVDERYSTREAKMKMKYEGIRGSVDCMAAACLLERYVEDEGGGALPALACDYPIPSEISEFDYNIVKNYIRDTHFKEDKSELAKGQAYIKKLKGDGNNKFKKKRR